jgi:hypothetical protein
MAKKFCRKWQLPRHFFHENANSLIVLRSANGKQRSVGTLLATRSFWPLVTISFLHFVLNNLFEVRTGTLKIHL